MLCDRIHAIKDEGGVRAILGVISLAKKHGADPVNEACKVAIDVGVPTYRFIRRWIERHRPDQAALRQIDPLIRELTNYRDLFNQMTENQER